MTQQLLIWLERDENGFLHSVRPVPELSAPRVLATVDAEDEIEYELSDPTPQEWLAFQSQIVKSWNEPEEDLYTLEDGNPINHDEK